MTQPDFPDFNSPQGNATAISLTGAPLLNLHNGISPNSGLLGPSTSTMLATVGFTQPAWEIAVSLSIPAAATSPHMRLQFTWTDQVTGNVVQYDEWYLPAGRSAVGANNYLGRGIALGNQLTITLGNPDAAQTLTYSVQVYQTSQLPLRQDIRLNSNSGFTVPGLTPPDLCDTNNLIMGLRKVAGQVSGGTDTIILPPYAGKIGINAGTGSGTSDLGITISAVGNTSVVLAGSTQVVYSGVTDNNGNLNATVALPRCACQVQMHNTNAGAQTTHWLATMQEY